MDSFFRHFGISAQPFPSEIVGKYAGRKVVVVAGAACVWDDLSLLGIRGADSPWDVLCVNDIFMHYPGRVDHLYSNDRKRIPGWISVRRAVPRCRSYHGPRRASTFSNCPVLR